MAYNPYSDIEAVLNAKIGWNNATTDEERKKHNETANKARNTLEAYGYGDVVKQISAEGADATATRKILEQYAPNKVTNYPIETNNLKSDEVNRENAGVFEKWNDFYKDTVTTDPFKTSEGKAIMNKYDLKALQGRDNAVASGSASNGGNIDSYAAANAQRQQAALVNQGQMAVLESHKQKIDNVRGILSDMGVNIDRVFNQDETAKNNDVARKSEIADVTGYVPNEWTIENDDIYKQFLNPDGTFKSEYNDVDIQALINQAKASGDTETAKKLAVVRTRKIFSNYGDFGKYANAGDISSMKPQQTEAGRQFDKEDDATREALGLETDLEREKIQAEKEINNANLKNKIDLVGAEKDANIELLEKQKEIQEGAVGYELTDEDKNMAKLVVKQINDNLRSDTSNPDARDLIKYNNGQVLLNLPKGHKPTKWASAILRPLFESSLNAKAAYTFAKKLGFSEEDITKAANAIK